MFQGILKQKVMFSLENQEILFQLECILRIVLSGLCGLVVGYERKRRGKGAGTRTHLVVALASALMMIVSKYGFADMAQVASDVYDTRLDPSRLASQIVTGVGFLGAGMIYFNRGTITGLTTAAGIWATSGVGMAIGAGMYFIGILTTIIMIVAQTILHQNIKLSGIKVEEQITFVIENTDEAVNYVQNILTENNLSADNMSYNSIDNDLVEIEIYTSSVNHLTVNKLLTLTRGNTYIKSVKFNTDNKIAGV